MDDHQTHSQFLSEVSFEVYNPSSIVHVCCIGRMSCYRTLFFVGLSLEKTKVLPENMDSNDFDVEENFSILCWKFIDDIRRLARIFKRNHDEMI